MHQQSCWWFWHFPYPKILSLLLFAINFTIKHENYAFITFTLSPCCQLYSRLVANSDLFAFVFCHLSFKNIWPSCDPALVTLNAPITLVNQLMFHNMCNTLSTSSQYMTFILWTDLSNLFKHNCRWSLTLTGTIMVLASLLHTNRCCSILHEDTVCLQTPLFWR